MNETFQDEVSISVVRQRPWPLAIFLTLSIFAGAYQMWQGVRWLVIGSAPSRWLLIIPILLCVAQLMSVFAMFGWKRWGVYLWFACALAAGVLLFFAVPNLGSFFKILIPAIILFFCVLPAWEEFE